MSGINYSQLFAITLPESILELVSLLILVVDLGWMRRFSQTVRMSVATVLGVLGCLASLAWLVCHPANLAVMDGGLVASPVVAAAQAGILAITALVLLLGVSSRFTRNPGEYVTLVLLATTGMMLVAASRDILLIFVALELLSLSLYVLAAFAKSSPRSAEAALKYYLFGGMSAAFLLFGFSYLYGIAGTTGLAGIASALAAGTTPLAVVALVLVAVGLGFKVAVVPFHLWAPDTYQGAPTPVAALIASGSKVASFAVLIAVTTALIPSAGRTVVLLAMAVASILLGNLAALVQTSVRRLLAYSAIAHAGYMLLGISAHSPQSNQAVLTYALTYALTTVGAFGVVAIVERETGSDRLDAFAGLSARNPLLSGTLLIFLLSLAGIPPLVGFWVKFNLFAAVLQSTSAHLWSLATVILAVAASAVSLYYYLQVLKRAYVLKPANPEPIPAGFVEIAVLVLIALATLALGLAPNLLAQWITLG
uniref:NADH:ubiquinone oxidoreductase, membrane subunit N n=1 Tax=mine drainage metagenome TaxID=410659 RepID=E6QMJ9_9ZZZZ